MVEMDITNSEHLLDDDDSTFEKLDMATGSVTSPGTDTTLDTILDSKLLCRFLGPKTCATVEFG